MVRRSNLWIRKFDPTGWNGFVWRRHGRLPGLAHRTGRAVCGMSLMVTTSREWDRTERRVLGALRCVDATTGAPLLQDLQIEAPPSVRIQRSRSGLVVLHEWLPLAAAPGGAGPLALTLSVSDPKGQYLARLVRIHLARDTHLARAALAGSLFHPLVVPMYLASSGRIRPQWAALSASLRDAGSSDALGGVLLRVVSDGQVLARGISDWRGEALVPVVGMPTSTWSAEAGAVVVTEISATLEAIADPASVTRTAQSDVVSDRAPSALPLVDPVALEAARDRLPQASAPIGLVAGRPLHVSLAIALP